MKILLLGIETNKTCYHYFTVNFFLVETASDQSDVEGRIRALNQELIKRKREAEQLKKEAKRRDKERLKAQEASLKKQIEVRTVIQKNVEIKGKNLRKVDVNEKSLKKSFFVVRTEFI